MRKWYEYGDKRSAELFKKIKKEFKRSRLTLDFDGLNVMKAKSVTTNLYKRLDKMNRMYMQDVADNAYREAQLEVKPEDKPSKLPAKWLITLLLAYNAVTKYVYDHEVDRKRARLFEATMADKYAEDQLELISDYTAACNAWLLMAEEYIIDVEDAATLEGYADSGVKRVRWKAEIDSRTCEICQARDGVIFPIDDVPSKPHYRCRCTLEPIIGEDGGD